MVGLVLVAHSPELVRGLTAMIGQAAPGVPVETAGGTADGRLGTSAPEIARALRACLAAVNGDGIVVLLDMGSAAMAIEIAIEDLDPVGRAAIRVTEAPLVEGAILAAIEAVSGQDVDGVARAAMRAVGAAKLPPA